MYLVLLGAPGAGKSTQVERLKGKLGLVHIAAGDLLRKAVRERTPLGQKAEDFVKQGRLVSNDIILELLEDKIRKQKKGFILDGFPRNLFQAKKLDEILHTENRKLDSVINLGVKEAVIVERLSKRLVCSGCGRIYNNENLGDVNSACPVCGASFLQRDDDNPEAIKERIRSYLKHTRPLIIYYRKKKILYSVEGERTSNQITEEILDFLSKKEKI